MSILYYIYMTSLDINYRLGFSLVFQGIFFTNRSPPWQNRQSAKCAHLTKSLSPISYLIPSYISSSFTAKRPFNNAKLIFQFMVWSSRHLLDFSRIFNNYKILLRNSFDSCSNASLSPSSGILLSS